MWKFMTGIARRMKLDMISIGGMEDHAHMLITLRADLDLAKAINTLKVNSSRWMKGAVPSFAWQRGYGAFSVSSSNIDKVKKYIENQEKHHAKRDFDSEFVELLERHRVKYDPKYVFG
jgi:REP element-mobilizing transposase RayT